MGHIGWVVWEHYFRPGMPPIFKIEIFEWLGYPYSKNIENSTNKGTLTQNNKEIYKKNNRDI